MNQSLIETAHLVLLPLSIEDAPALQKFGRWEVVEFLNDRVPWPFPPNASYEYIRNVALPTMAEGRAWHWTIRERTHPSEIIGEINVKDEPGNNRGFWIAPEHWKKGYGTEAANAVTNFWFETLGRPLLRVPKAIANTGSRRISETQGMRVIGVEEKGYVSGRLQSEIWEITREEWRARKSGQF